MFARNQKPEQSDRPRKPVPLRGVRVTRVYDEQGRPSYKCVEVTMELNRPMTEKETRHVSLAR